MTDFFINSINEAIEKADTAEENMKEIAEVFSSLSNSFIRISNSKVALKIIKKHGDLPKNGLLATAVAAQMFLNQTEPYNALILKNINNTLTAEIAEVIYSEDGYPIRLKIKDNTKTYYDKESLIDGLNEIIKSTEVGKAYKRLLD